MMSSEGSGEETSEYEEYSGKYCNPDYHDMPYILLYNYCKQKYGMNSNLKLSLSLSFA